jgi:hypothetical protein
VLVLLASRTPSAQKPLSHSLFLLEAGHVQKFDSDLIAGAPYNAATFAIATPA